MTDKEKLDLAIDALKFYANGKIYADTHKSSKANKRVLPLEDCDSTEFSNLGGKKARNVLLKIQG